MSAKRVVAVIQARMGSTRLPGKVMRPVAGKPLLWHVVHRLRKARTVNAIVLAITDGPEDDVLAGFAQGEGIAHVRGPAEDVLGRFARAAALTDPDVVVRVTGDAPIIDPEFVDLFVSALIAEDADFVMGRPDQPCAHEGVDPFSRRALDHLLTHAREDPIAREHVSGWFKMNPHAIRVARIDIPARWRFTGARLSLDTPSDAAFLEEVHARLQAQAGEASLSDLLSLLRREPQLLGINGHVRAKGLETVKRTALLRTAASSAAGHGHLKRMLALGTALRDRQSFAVRFALSGDAAAFRAVQDAGFAADPIDPSTDETAQLEQLILDRAADVLVLDLPGGPDEAGLARLGAAALTAVIDDAAPRRRAADLAFYPPVAGAYALDWAGSPASVHIGFDWTILGAAPRPRAAPRRSGTPTVLLMGGGSDAFGLLRPLAHATRGLDAVRIAVAGPSVRDHAALIADLSAAGCRVADAPSDLAPLYADADLAIAGFGVSAYELAAAGVPAVLVCPTDDHRSSAAALDDAGAAVAIDARTEGWAEAAASAAADLLGDGETLYAMSAVGRMILDGRGADRIAAAIASAYAARGAAGQFSQTG